MCNRLVFGVKSDKPLTPITIKKMLLVLIAANILSHTATVDTLTISIGDDNNGVSVTIKAVLEYLLR